MLQISKPSLLKYCSLVQYFCSVTNKSFVNFTSTFLDVARADSIFVDKVFSSNNSPIKKVKKVVKLMLVMNNNVSQFFSSYFYHRNDRNDKKYVILKVFHYDRKIRTKFHIRPYTWNSHKKNYLMQIALTLMTLIKQLGAKIKGKF